MPLTLPGAFTGLKEEQKRILIGVLVFVVAFFICYKYIYKNAVRKAASYRNKTQGVIAQNKLREQLHTLGGVKKGYEGLIIRARDIDSFKNELSKLVLSSGAKVKSISSTRKPGRGDYVVFSTIMEIKCDYNQLGSFISKIENAQPHIRIEAIALTGGEARLSVGRRGRSRLPETQPEDDVAASVNLAVETYSLRK